MDLEQEPRPRRLREAWKRTMARRMRSAAVPWTTVFTASRRAWALRPWLRDCRSGMRRTRPQRVRTRPSSRALALVASIHSATLGIRSKYRSMKALASLKEMPRLAERA